MTHDWIFDAFYDLRALSNVFNKGDFTAKEIAIQAFNDTEDLISENIDAIKSFLNSLGNVKDHDYEDSLETLSKASPVFAGLCFSYEIRQEKMDFVAKELTALTRKADVNVDSLTYFATNDGDEFVVIVFNSGYERKVTVTADSKIALARDVLAAIH